MTKNLLDAEKTLGGNGFLLAFEREESYESEKRVGFSLLLPRRDFLVAFYATPVAGTERIETRCDYQSCVGGVTADDEEAFVIWFLKNSAVNMGLTYARLVIYFAGRSSLWPFVGYADGEFDGLDTSPRWREKLWPLVMTMVTNRPKCLDCMPIEHGDTVVSSLLAHGNDAFEFSY